jgi:GTPase SAR1 family protein
MVFIAFIIGTAGSGKSLLTASFSEWLKINEQDVATLNLDPGAIKLPYTPDIDVRDYITIDEIMDEYELGPNGALIMAADLIAGEIENISREIEELNPDILLVDTPGQMELFAFRASGPYIAREISRDPKAIIYLFDAVFSLNPLNYVSNMFLSAAVYMRFLLPQLHVLSKCDLLFQGDVDIIIEWSEDRAALEAAINKKLEGERRLLSHRLSRAIYQLGLNFPLISVSAKTNEGFLDLNAALERIFAGGEKITY